MNFENNFCLKSYPSFYRRDLHNNRSVYFIEVIGRLFPQQREFLKSNNYQKIIKYSDYLYDKGIAYRIFEVNSILLEEFGDYDNIKFISDVI